jgi:hypothetical protein
VGRLADAGFTTGTPWIAVNPDHASGTPSASATTPTSVFAHHRRLIALRHEDPVVALGDFTMLLPEHDDVYAFTRALDGATLLVVCNVSGTPQPLADLLPEAVTAEVVLGNLPRTTPRCSGRGRRGCSDPLDDHRLVGREVERVGELVGGQPPGEDRHDGERRGHQAGQQEGAGQPDDAADRAGQCHRQRHERQRDEEVEAGDPAEQRRGTRRCSSVPQMTVADSNAAPSTAAAATISHSDDVQPKTTSGAHPVPQSRIITVR